MDYFYLKALHIIFVVTWFAGLFYIVRLFIYFVEAEAEDENAKVILQRQYKIMTKRLWYGITWPSAIITAFFAGWLFYNNFSHYLAQPWMHIKLVFVTALYAYHFICQSMVTKLLNNKLTVSSFKLRLWNEVATVLLFAIVFIVVLQSAISWIWGLIGILLFSLLLMLGIKAYKSFREKKNKLQ